jgi:hypothetical protein
MMKRIEFDDYITELAHRFSIAEVSLFSGVTYASAEKMVNAVRKGKPPGSFWISLAEHAEAARTLSMNQFHRSPKFGSAFVPPKPKKEPK